MSEDKIWESDLTENAVLSFKKVPFHFHTVDRSLLRVTNKAIKNNKKIVINYPLHRCDLLVPLTIEACYSLINGKRKKVLLITKKLEVREFYNNIFQAGGKISKFLFPIGMVSRKGEIKPIYDTIRGLSKRDKEYIKDSTVFLSSSLKYLPTDTSDLGTVIIDVDKSYEPEAIDYMLQWADEHNIKSILFVTSESATDNINHFNSLGIPIWGWTPSMLKKEFELEDIGVKSPEAPFYRSAMEVRRITNGLKREAIQVETPERFKNMLYEAYKFYRECWKVFHVKKIPLLKEALFTYSRAIKVIERIAAPIRIVEEEEETSWGVLSLTKRVEKLKAIQEKLFEDEKVAANLLSNAASNIERIKDWLADNENPKYRQIKSIIDTSKGKKVCFVFFRTCDKNAFIEAIKFDLKLDEQQLSERGIHFATHTDIHTIYDSLDSIFISGAVPQYAKFLLRSAQAEKINFLIYPTELVVLEREIEVDNEVWNNEFSLNERSYAIENLINVEPKIIKQRIHKQYENAQPPELQARIIKELERDAQKEKIGDEPLTDFFSEIMPKKGDSEDFQVDVEETDEDFGIDYESDEAILSEDGVEINAIRIDFDDGESIVVSESKRLPIFIEFKDQIAYKETSKLTKKEIVIIINKGTKETLAQSIFKVLHSLPSMKRTVVYAQSWSLMLRKEMKKHNMDSWAVVSKMQEHGTKIREPLTVTHWVLGETIGPRDKQDILRLGKIFQNEFLINNFSQISEAVTTLRGIHHKLVRKLKMLIPKAGMKAMRGESIDDEMISPELGLHVEDFYDAISLKRIVSTTKVRADYSLCNNLIRTEQLKYLEERKNEQN